MPIVGGPHVSPGGRDSRNGATASGARSRTFGTAPSARNKVASKKIASTSTAQSLIVWGKAFSLSSMGKLANSRSRAQKSARSAGAAGRNCEHHLRPCVYLMFSYLSRDQASAPSGVSKAVPIISCASLVASGRTIRLLTFHPVGVRMNSHRFTERW